MRLAHHSAVAGIRLWEGETVVRKRYQQGCCYPRLQALDAAMRPALTDPQRRARLKTQERMRLPSGRVGKIQALFALRCDPALCRAPASCTPAGLAAAPDPNRRRPPAQAGAGKRAGPRRTVTSWLGTLLPRDAELKRGKAMGDNHRKKSAHGFPRHPLSPPFGDLGGVRSAPPLDQIIAVIPDQEVDVPLIARSQALREM
jgi:hypothetical protein